MGKKYEYDTLIHEIPEKGGAYVIFRGISARSLEKDASRRR